MLLYGRQGGVDKFPRGSVAIMCGSFANSQGKEKGFSMDTLNTREAWWLDDPKGSFSVGFC